MADLFFQTGGNFSALTPQRVVAGAYAPVINYNTVDALNTTRYQAFTASGAGDMEGAVLCLRVTTDTTTDNVTCTLQQDTGGGFGDVAGATKTLTVANIAGTHSAVVRASPAWVYFKFATPKTITTNAAMWRLKISSNTVNIQIYQTYGYACVLTATTTYTSGDNVVLNGGEIYTQDQSITATNLIMGVNTHWLVPSTVAAAYALTVTNWWFSKDCRLALGEDDTHRIPFANQFTLTVTNWKTGDGYVGGQDFELEMWGEKPAHYFSLLNADAAATPNKTLVTTTDMSSYWAHNDVLIVTGRNTAGSGYESMTLDTISGTSVVCTAAFAAIHFSGWVVINSTLAVKCGIIANIGLTNAYGYNTWLTVNISGVSIPSVNKVLYFPNGVATGAYFDGARLTKRTIDTVIMSAGASIQINDTSTNLVTTTLAGGIFRYIFAWGTTANNTYLYLYFVFNCAIDNIYLFSNGQNITVLANITATNCISMANIQIAGGWNVSSVGTANFNFSGCIISNLKILHGGAASLLLVSISTTFNVGSLDYALSHGIYINGTVASTVFNNFNFGQDHANATDDIYYPVGYYGQIITNNCKFTAAKEVGNISNAALTSFARAANYDAVANDNRSWWNYGLIQSVGSGLTDTTVHTTGAGKFAIRLQPTSSVNSFTDWNFIIPTGDITGRLMTIACWCKINTATYYAGTHTNPTLSINYDNGTVLTAVAANSTAWQLLLVNFTPTTSYGQVTVTISGMTDALTTDAYFYIDDFAVLYPAGYSLNLGGLDLWANALPVVPPINTLFTSQDVFLAATSQMTGAGTIGKFLTDMLDATISSRLASASYTAPPSAATIAGQVTTDHGVGSYVSGGTPPTAAAIADAVLDEAAAGHTGVIAVNLDAKVSLIPTNPYTGTPPTVGQIDTQLSLTHGAGSWEDAGALDNASIDAILDRPADGILTLRDALKVLLAEMAGEASGGGTAVITYQNPAGTKNRVILDVDANGNRSNVTLDLS